MSGKREFRRVRLSEFTELSEGVMDEIEMVWRIVCWDKNCFQGRLWAKEATSATKWR